MKRLIKQILLLLMFSISAFAQQPPNILLINIDDMGWREETNAPVPKELNPEYIGWIKNKKAIK